MRHYIQQLRAMNLVGIYVLVCTIIQFIFYPGDGQNFFYSEASGLVICYVVICIYFLLQHKYIKNLNYEFDLCMNKIEEKEKISSVGHSISSNLSSIMQQFYSDFSNKDLNFVRAQNAGLHNKVYLSIYLLTRTKGFESSNKLLMCVSDEKFEIHYIYQVHSGIFKIIDGLIIPYNPASENFVTILEAKLKEFIISGYLWERL